jgi:hypothetical protein
MTCIAVIEFSGLFKVATPLKAGYPAEEPICA